MKSLVVFPKFGLANRLRAIASASILAEMTRRKLYVNWIPYSKCNVKWEELFDNEFPSYPIPLSAFREGIDLYDDNNDIDNFYLDMPRSLAGNASAAVAVYACCNFRHHAMSEETYKVLKSSFYRNLRPVAEVRSAVDDICRRHFEGRTVVGVHIRRTDHLHYEKKDPARVSPTALFIQRMRSVIEHNPETLFFLATDDHREEKMLRVHFPNNLVTHDKEPVRRDTLTGMRDALTDWLLLSRTSQIIRSSKSSFSEEAAAVNMIGQVSILQERELSRTHYTTFLKAHLGSHYRILKQEGLISYLRHSYYFRKGEVLHWLRSRNTKRRHD